MKRLGREQVLEVLANRALGRVREPKTRAPHDRNAKSPATPKDVAGLPKLRFTSAESGSTVLDVHPLDRALDPLPQVMDEHEVPVRLRHLPAAEVDHRLVEPMNLPTAQAANMSLREL